MTLPRAVHVHYPFKMYVPLSLGQGLEKYFTAKRGGVKFIIYHPE